MYSLLFVHQSAELYGSDKILLTLVRGLDRRQYESIVMLPEEGPLSEALRMSGVTVYIVPVVKLSRASLSFHRLLKLPIETLQAIRAMNRALVERRIDLVHSNTLAVLGGALWAKINQVPHLWHVHEIIVHPKAARLLFPRLINLFADRVVCNSRATMENLLKIQPKLINKTITIWNGLDREYPPSIDYADEFRQRLGLSETTVLVTLMGRINRLKGHILFLNAAKILQRENGLDNIHFLFVGSPLPGQDYFRTQLVKEIENLALDRHVTLLGFQNEIWPIWDATDIAVVPSTEPESFGMVALEAMLAGKPVVASAQGGLLDIVEDETTGIYFEPNNAYALVNALRQLIENKEKRLAFGKAGRERALKVFSTRSYVSSFERIYAEIIVNKSNS